MITTFVETLNGRGRVVQLDGRLEFQPGEEVKKQAGEAIMAFLKRAEAQRGNTDDTDGRDDGVVIYGWEGSLVNDQLIVDYAEQAR